MEPTMKEIVEWLREAGRNEQKTFEFFGYDKSNALKKAQLWETRAAQVEAMGERRCHNCSEWLGGIHPVFGCSYDGLIHCKKLNIPGHGPNFGCIHWQRKGG